MKNETKQTNMSIGMGLVAAGLLASLSLSAAPSLYQKGESLTISNATDLTQTEVLHFTHDARGLAKDGKGVYTLPRGLVDGKNPFDLRVHEGRVILTDGGVQPDEAEPTTALNLASFWVQASANLATNEAGAVTTWHDCREQGGEGVFSNAYARAVTVTEPKNANSEVYDPVMPKVATPPDGTRPMINFGGMTTGTGMKFSTSYTAVRHVYAIIDFQSSVGFYLGSQSGYYPFCHPSNYDKAGLSGTYGNTDTYPASFQGEFLVNGVRCNPTETNVRKGLQLIELHADDHAPMTGLGAFFLDRGIGGRFGGDFIGEVLVYNGGTKTLSADERARVSRHLMAKWGIAAPKGKVTVKLAKGAEVESTSPDAAALTGPGVWVKGGANAAVYRPVTDNRMTGVSVSLEGGSLVADVRELNYAPRVGETVSETADKFARRTVTSSVAAADAAAGRVTFKGGGTGLRFGDLAEGVTNLVADAQQVILGQSGIRSAILSASGTAATIANASFETAFGANDWVTEVNDGGVWRLPFTTDAQVEDWRLGNPTAEFRLDCRHANFYAPEGSYVLGLHNGSIVRGQVEVPADGDYLFGFEASGRFTYDNEELTFSLIDANGVTNTFASCVTKCGDRFRPYRLPVRGLKAGHYTLRIAGTKHRSFRGYWGTESFALIDNLTLVPLADSSAVAGAVPVPNGSFEVSRFTSFDRAVETFGTNEMDCAGWTFDGTAADAVGPIARYMPKNYVAQSNPYGEWELHFNGTNGVATTAPFSIPAGRWKLRCRAVKWAYADNKWTGWDNGRNVHPVVNVTILVNGEERCVVQSAAVTSYDFITITFATPVEVAATDKIVLKVRQTTASDPYAANLKVDDFEFVPEAAAGGEFVKNNSFESGETSWTKCGASGSTTWVQALGPGMGNAADWGNQTFDGTHAMVFTRRGACRQKIDFAKAGVYRLSFWARSRVSNYGVESTSLFGGGIIRASLIDSAGTATTIAETPRILSTNFFETATLFRVPAAGAYDLKFEGLDTEDKTVMLDSVSVQHAADPAAPTVSEKLNLRLAEGTTLRLDYDGEVRVERLRIGNRRFYGEVDASDASGLITGIGRLVVTGARPGMAIFVR